MKKILLPVFILIPLFFIGQNIKKEKVKTSFLSYPKIDVAKMDISNIKVDFCIGNMKFVANNLKKTTNACKPKGGSIKDAKAIEVFYYQVAVLEPVSYLKISDNQGNIQYMERTTDGSQGFVDFGKDQCYWAEPVLKSAYQKEKANFEAKSQKEITKETMKKAREFLNGALFFTYIPQQIEVNYVKDKKQDYSDLERASSVALAGYEGIKDNAEDKDAQSKLQQAVSMWEKAMAESNTDNKDARINRKVTLALAENLGTAYMYLMEFDKAEKVVSDALALEKNITTNGTQDRKALLEMIKANKKGYMINKDIPINNNTANIQIQEHSSSEIGSFTEEYKKYANEAMAQDIKTGNDEYNKAVESGEVNPYQRFVVDVAGGASLTLPDLGAKLIKDPAGDKLDEFPEAITELTNVTTLTLRGNNLKSIPPDIGKMTNLKKLNLANNQLTTLPDEIGELKNLKNLILKGNNISPKEVSRIQSLLPNCDIKL